MRARKSASVWPGTWSNRSLVIWSPSILASWRRWWPLGGAGVERCGRACPRDPSACQLIAKHFRTARSARRASLAVRLGLDALALLSQLDHRLPGAAAIDVRLQHGVAVMDHLEEQCDDRDHERCFERRSLHSLSLTLQPLRSQSPAECPFPGRAREGCDHGRASGSSHQVRETSALGSGGLLEDADACARRILQDREPADV